METRNKMCVTNVILTGVYKSSLRKMFKVFGAESTILTGVYKSSLQKMFKVFGAKKYITHRSVQK